MKNDSNKTDLEQLLAAIEHAGRDSRRQQELGAMIDSLAEAEATKKRGFWWWSARIAAAACLFFFVTTAIRIWYIPTGSVNGARPIVAEITENAMPATAINDTTANPVVIPAVTPAVRHRKTSSTPTNTTTVQEATIEVLYANEVDTDEATETEEDSTETPYYIIIDDFAPDTELIADNTKPEQSTGEEPVASTPDIAQTTKPQRRKFLGGFLRRSEPSRMEGTTLALLQF